MKNTSKKVTLGLLLVSISVLGLSQQAFAENSSEVASVSVNEDEKSSIGVIKEVFPDPVFANYIAKQVRKTVDDTFTKADAEKIVDVIIFSRGERGLDNAAGIEQLPNLERLTIGFGNIETIDLSQNKKLKDITLQQTNNLLALDLSNNPEVEEIDISNLGEANSVNKLASLDITNCSKLKKLNVDYTLLM